MSSDIAENSAAEDARLKEAPQLTPEQAEVVSIFGRGLAITAGAGSGKSTTLVEKCLEFLKRHPDQRFLAVSFTERAARDLRRKLEGRGCDLEHHWVTTIHGFCGLVLREYPLEAGLQGDERVISEIERAVLWNEARDWIWSDDAPPEIRQAILDLGAGYSENVITDVINRLDQLAGFGAVDRLDASALPDRAFRDLYLSVSERYERRKLREGVIDFEDMERAAKRVIATPAARRELQNRFGLIVIDEFQDTNPIQAEILLGIARADRSNLVVMGDPKQSIYRFRDADVSLFEELCRALPERRSLTYNFRSRPGVLRYVNETCAPIFERLELEFESLHASRTPSQEAECIRLELSHPRALAHWLEHEAKRGIPLGDFTILVHRVRSGNLWLEEFRKLGVPFEVSGGTGLGEEPMYRELLALLRAWSVPENLASLVAVLRAPWVGFPDVQIDRVIEEKGSVWAEFLASANPVARALAPLWGKPVRPGQVLEALEEIADAWPPEERDVWEALWLKVEDLSYAGMSFGAVLRALDQAQKLVSKREAEIPPTTAQDRVKILTVHGSKGLEFKQVLVLDFESQYSSEKSIRKTPKVFWNRGLGVLIPPRDDEGDVQKKGERFLEFDQAEQRLETADELRLFYVALTRAEERLILCSFPMKEKSKALEKECWRAWLEQSSAPKTELADPGESYRWSFTSASEEHDVQSPRAQAISVKRKRHSVTEWLEWASCPKRYGYRFSPHAIVAPEEDHASTEVADFGTQVHALLETENAAGARELGLEQVAEWMEHSALMAELPEVYRELAFECEVGDALLVGTVDRLIRLPAESSGKLQLIDFKTTARDHASGEVSERYILQLAIYRAALERFEPVDSKAWIVQIPRRGPVQEIQVSVPDLSLDRFPEEIDAAVAQGFYTARPSSECRFCPYRSVCTDRMSEA